MLKLVEAIMDDVPYQDVVSLPYESRVKCRLHTRMESGEEVGLFLPRGTILRDGYRLRAEDGRVVLVRAAAEKVSTARVDDPYLLARACYHLGNRHVALQIVPDYLRYLHDHVLDDMLIGLGLNVQVEEAPFEPEAGAYHTHSH